MFDVITVLQDLCVSYQAVLLAVWLKNYFNAIKVIIKQVI